MKPIRTTGPSITRVFYNLADFRVRLSENSPVHYDIDLNRLDPPRDLWAQTFRVYGTDRKGGLIVHESRWIHTSGQASARKAMADSFITRVAAPLNGVPGRLEVSDSKERIGHQEGTR